MEYLSIQLAVYRTDIATPEMITFDPKEYFDLDDDEEADVDSAPIHSDLCDYVSNKKDVTKLALNIKNSSNRKMVTVEKVYQNGKRADVTTRCDYQDGVLIYKEIIFQSKLPESLVSEGDAYDLCRFVVRDGETKCIYHAIFHYNDAGEESEYQII